MDRLVRHSHKLRITNMKKILLILITIGVVLGLFYTFFVLFMNKSEKTDNNPPLVINLPPISGTSTNDFPAGNNQTIPVRTRSGDQTSVRDFRKDRFVETIPDNTYILRDTDSPSTATFEILYFGNGGGIIISLRNEPLQETRSSAETALIQHLGIAREKLCDLSISVAVARDVNTYYAGRELGISSCPGSLVLPK